MKNLLLKMAHHIISKYGVVELRLEDKLLMHGITYEIVGYDVSRKELKIRALNPDHYEFADRRQTKDRWSVKND